MLYIIEVLVDLKWQVSNVSVFVIFVRLCDISVLLLGIVMHSGFIWFGRYIFEVQGRSCLERTQVMAFLVVHLWICYASLLPFFCWFIERFRWFVHFSTLGTAVIFLARGMLKVLCNGFNIGENGDFCWLWRWCGEWVIHHSLSNLFIEFFAE